MTFTTAAKTIWSNAKANPMLATVAVIVDVAFGAFGTLIVLKMLGVI